MALCNLHGNRTSHLQSLGERVCLLYGLKKQGEAYLSPALCLRSHRCQSTNQTATGHHNEAVIGRHVGTKEVFLQEVASLSRVTQPAASQDYLMQLLTSQTAPQTMTKYGN